MANENHNPLHMNPRSGFRDWVRSGEPMVWANAAAVSICVIAVVGLLLLLAVRGFGHFWPADILHAQVVYGDESHAILGERVQHENISTEQLSSAGVALKSAGAFHRLPIRPRY